LVVLSTSLVLRYFIGLLRNRTTLERRAGHRAGVLTHVSWTLA